MESAAFIRSGSVSVQESAAVANTRSCVATRHLCYDIRVIKTPCTRGADNNTLQGSSIMKKTAWSDEPRLDDILSDPIVRAIMRRDRQDERVLRSLLDRKSPAKNARRFDPGLLPATVPTSSF